MCLIDYSDPPEFYRSEMRRARKEHRCSECRRVLGAGERYEYAFGKQEGETFECRTCEHCLAVARWLKAVCGGWCHEALCDDLEEHLNETYYNPRWLAIATSGIRKGWRNKDGSMRRPMSLPKNLPIPEPSA